MSLFPSEISSNPTMATRLRVVRRRTPLGIPLLLCALITPGQSRAQSPVPVDLSRFNQSSEVSIERKEGVLQVRWPASMTETAWLALNLEPGQPLFDSVGIAAGEEGAEPIAQRFDPFFSLTIGLRDPAKARQAMVFFDNPRHRAFDTHVAALDKKGVRVSSEAGRATLAIEEISAGSFRGHIEINVYPRSPLIHVTAVMGTDESLRAIIYDAGLVSRRPGWNRTVWIDSVGRTTASPVTRDGTAWPIEVNYRAVAAENGAGSLAVFPHPHQYFYPLDFADNFGFAWFGEGYGGSGTGYGLGIRQPPDGDRRFVPWVDAPAGSLQRMSVFYFLSSKDGAGAIDEVAEYTHRDKFKKLPGYRTFTSHYHVEHTDEFLREQREQNTAGVPKGLESPGFVSKFKETGVEIVHLAEFHFGRTPRLNADERLPMLKAMHDECARLSDGEILILPGEEPNVHLGGHWISFFPKPVYWILNRDRDQPFVEEVDGYGKVYRVGSSEDVLRLMELEEGLMWTAHARIKSSLAFPDAYRNEEFYKSDHFLGAAWKAMPADLSKPELGWRVLDLLDDMNNWGERKQALGEVDVFRVEPDYELYAHMNINYVKMDEVPRYGDGWKPVLDVLRAGEFFVTTGEVLIPEFAVGGAESGEVLALEGEEDHTLRAKVEWTFPLNYAEVVMGDGSSVYRQKIDLRETEEFGSRIVETQVNLKGKKWVRFELWDIAANGAFTQPVWVVE